MDRTHTDIAALIRFNRIKHVKQIRKGGVESEERERQTERKETELGDK